MAKEENVELVTFQAQDGQVKVEVTTDYDTVWLSQQQLVELFQRDKSVISRHINNIFKEDELDRNSVVANFATTAADGKTYQVDHYNLDVIISVGYRVKSQRGVEFRQWASKILKQYLIDGYAINETRIDKAPGSLVELFKMQVQLWERQELLNTEIKEDIKQIGDKIQSIESRIKSVDDNYYTIAGYCSLNKIPCPLHKAKEWGKAATKLSREKEYETGVVHDERFGRVRTYHQDILKDVIK